MTTKQNTKKNSNPSALSKVKQKAQVASIHSSKQKLHWSQSQLAWLVGTKAIDNSGCERQKMLIEKLCRRLLDIGGNQICVPFEEPPWWNAILAEHGQVLRPSKIVLKKGEPSNCNRNSARIWQSNKGKYILFKGYGLSDDQMWRLHWWLVDKQGNIIETTKRRLIYYGFGYSSCSAQEFSNLIKDL